MVENSWIAHLLLFSEIERLCSRQQLSGAKASLLAMPAPRKCVNPIKKSAGITTLERLTVSIECMHISDSR